MTGAVYRCGGRLTPGGRCQQDLVGSVGRIDETLRSWIIAGCSSSPCSRARSASVTVAMSRSGTGVLLERSSSPGPQFTVREPLDWEVGAVETEAQGHCHAERLARRLRQRAAGAPRSSSRYTRSRRPVAPTLLAQEAQQ